MSICVLGKASSGRYCIRNSLVIQLLGLSVFSAEDWTKKKKKEEEGQPLYHFDLNVKEFTINTCSGMM